MSEYIVDALWMAEYERGIESLLGVKLEYDGNDNPTPPLPRRNIIVRCRDCKRFDAKADGCWWFSHFEQMGDYSWDEMPAEVEPDGFCAWGERK